MFGPYVVKGEVQKRVSGKAYGIIFTDLVVGAVHIEAVYGYDTQSFLMALSSQRPFTATQIRNLSAQIEN